MLFKAVNRVAVDVERGRIDEFARHVGRLLRHPAYRRDRIVSPMLLRYLPAEWGYAWHGEDALRERIARAALDDASLDHLIGNVRSEVARLRKPDDA